MKLKMFYDIDHAKSYLINSIVMYHGNPILITDVCWIESGEIYKIMYNPIGSDDICITYYPDEGFNLNPVPLGVANLEEGIFEKNISLWFARTPARQWKIGLCSGNAYLNTTNMGWGDSEKYSVKKKLLRSKCLKNLILGKYPSWKQAREKVMDSSTISCAFSRRFWIDKDHNLHYQWLEEKVGSVVKSGINLDDDFFYLKEVLQEDMSNGAN